MSGFRVGGYGEYQESLCKEVCARFRELEKELNEAATSKDQARICQQMDVLNSEYEQKLHGRLLF